MVLIPTSCGTAGNGDGNDANTAIGELLNGSSTRASPQYNDGLTMCVLPTVSSFTRAWNLAFTEQHTSSDVSCKDSIKKCISMDQYLPVVPAVYVLCLRYIKFYRCWGPANASYMFKGMQGPQSCRRVTRRNAEIASVVQPLSACYNLII